jgi:hypothetical protein
MTKEEEDNFEMRDEYDFSNAIRNPYVQRFQELNLISLDPDVKAVFPDSESVNEALRLLIKAAKSAQDLQKPVRARDWTIIEGIVCRASSSNGMMKKPPQTCKGAGFPLRKLQQSSPIPSQLPNGMMQVPILRSDTSRLAYHC